MSREFKLYLLFISLSILTAILTCKMVHSVIQQMNVGGALIGVAVVVIGARFGYRLLVYVRKVWIAFKFIRKYKL